MPRAEHPHGTDGPAGQGRAADLTAGQLTQITRFSDQWSFLWDKRRAVWIAAEDSPDGEQIEEADLDVLLARLSIAAGHC